MHDNDYWIHSAVYEMFEYSDTAKNLLENEEKSRSEIFRKLAEDLKKAINAKDWKAYNKVNYDAAQNDVNYFKEGENNVYWESKEYFELKLRAAKYRFEHEIPPFHSNWKNRLLDNVLESKLEAGRLKDLPLAEQDKKAIADLEEAALIGEYRLDHNISVSTSPSDGVTSETGYGEPLTFWDVFTTSALGINLISVLIIIIAGSVISSEFSSGTVKYLLVNPVKRYKIFIAKYISVLSFAFIMLLAYYLFNVILSGIFFGFGDLGAPHLYVSDGNVIKGSSFLFVASKYLTASAGMICMATFALAVSSVARSSALSIGLGVFLYLSGYGVVALLSQLKLDFGRYIIFSNLELNTIAEGSSLYKGQTVFFALMVIIVYMLVFLLTAWDGFVRKDVK